MGADMCVAIFYEPMEKSFKPNWKKGYECIKEFIEAGDFSAIDYLDSDPEGLEDILCGKLENIKGAYEGAHRELTYLELPPYRVYITGGMSWGDSPSEIYNDINDLDNVGVLEAVGFNQVIDYQKIVKNLLSKKELLPLLMSINPELDTLISKALNKKGKRK